MPCSVDTLTTSPHSQVSVTREKVGIGSASTMAQKFSISRLEQRPQMRWRMASPEDSTPGNIRVL